MKCHKDTVLYALLDRKQKVGLCVSPNNSVWVHFGFTGLGCCTRFLLP